MKTAKITEITGTREWTKWEHWPVFYISMKLDNDETITLGKKKADAFKVWDTVSYEENGENRWKEVKENTFKPRTYNTESTNKWAMVGMAIKLAFDKVYEWEEDFQKAAYLSERIFELAMEMYNWGEKSETKLEENTDNDNLPF